jgi:hypothetical protein
MFYNLKKMEFTRIDEEILIDPNTYNPNEEKLNNIKRKIPFSYYCISWICIIIIFILLYISIKLVNFVFSFL